ncbi:ectonucleoside triphosphate diphosphohydrolase 2 isoform X3 [Diceros bicornis minor]|uniref:ectonucleoside triphosphate diphosphohydrolase 2 isoform X3 n=1 Tax=Diceros bicornis minor TaxID=77932 RepID=UPI0026EC2A85|nr:ectonucleoside triphosphate diphosphohydrolase 2 isoform X3 [Diceros bicornis minor]
MLKLPTLTQGGVGWRAEGATGHGHQASAHIPEADLHSHPQYGIVLDAGSSHTSMFIYKWPADKENDTGIVGQHSSCNVHGGGISSYADNPSGAGQSLVKCLDQALRDVPKERHVGTPLYLGATAGMRLLNLTSPEASANVLAAVTQTLTQYPFDFRGARILSGQEEGVFGWVTANYLLENFIKYGWVGRWFRPRKGMLGAMDLGGASTQITFETASPAEDPANEVQLRLYGQHYRVYTHSFLCYGTDQVLKRLLAGALQTHSSHPCWPRGYFTQVQLQDVYGSPCTAAQRPPTFNSSAKVSVSGSSDPALCRSLVLRLFNFSSCGFSRCSFNGIFQPPVAGNFIVSPRARGWGLVPGDRCPEAHRVWSRCDCTPSQAFSAFFYTMDFLTTVMGLPVATLRQLEAAVVTICNQTWSEVAAALCSLGGHPCCPLEASHPGPGAGCHPELTPLLPEGKALPEGALILRLASVFLGPVTWSAARVARARVCVCVCVCVCRGPACSRPPLPVGPRPPSGPGPTVSHLRPSCRLGRRGRGPTCPTTAPRPRSCSSC